MLDTFAGSGATLAAAQAIGLHAIGVERVSEYVALASGAILKLAAYQPDGGSAVPPQQERLALL